jgi:hypothetical protein
VLSVAEAAEPIGARVEAPRPLGELVEARLTPRLTARATGWAGDGNAALSPAANSDAIVRAGGNITVSPGWSLPTSSDDVAVMLDPVLIGAGSGWGGASRNGDPTSSATAIHNPTRGNPPRIGRVRHLPSQDHASMNSLPDATPTNSSNSN